MKNVNETDSVSPKAAVDGNDELQATGQPRVSIIVPCRNERHFIADFVGGVLKQADVVGGLELIIADGGSDDGTREVLDGLAESNPRIKVVDNPRRIVSTGLNAAIAHARGEIILRMDVHTRYADDYVRKSVEALESSKADNVGGPWRAAGRSYLQEAIALAFNSAFAVGGARSRQQDYEGEVDTVYLGCWRRDYLLAIGLFDEDLVRNQDDELNLRITRSGGRVWQAPGIRSWYYPRSSLGGLFRQYMQYGYWKVRVIQKHKLPASIRHLVPAAFVVALGSLALLAPFSTTCVVLLGLLLATYAALSLVASVKVGMHRPATILVLPVVFACFHVGYGTGFLAGMWMFFVSKAASHRHFERITR